MTPGNSGCGVSYDRPNDYFSYLELDKGAQIMSDRLALIRALHGAGLQVESLEAGRLIRCKTDADKGLQKSGWYRLFDDANLMTCVYGDWRNDSRGVWVGGDIPQTPEQRANAKRLIEQDRQERQQEQARQEKGRR